MCVQSILRDTIEKSCARQGLACRFHNFQGECHHEEVTRLIEECRNAKVIVGAGGGRTVDTAKLIAQALGLPMVALPTLASTDAPVSRIAVLNSPSGAVEEIRILPPHPEMVLVDSAIIAQAPLRLLADGMGDALATWFEARACHAAYGRNLFGGRPTQAALAVAERCWQNLISYGREAVDTVKEGCANEAVEIIVETNILLSGLGFENGGLALAHALHNGLTQLPESYYAMHGEKVAFGLLVQCVVERAEETKEVLSLMLELGLPVTLAELGCEADEEALRVVVDYVFTRERSKVENEPVEVTPSRLLKAILRADALGHAACWWR